MPGRQRALGVLAAAALAAAPEVAMAEDIGVPRGPNDIFLLDDGRILYAKALPPQSDGIPLEFYGYPVRVPAERIAFIRRWSDFDPTPRNAAEEAEVAKGRVRFDGRWIEPAAAKKRAAEWTEKRDRRLSVGSAACFWSDRVRRDAGRFRVESNARESVTAAVQHCLAGLSRSLLQDFRGVPSTEVFTFELWGDLQAQEIAMANRWKLLQAQSSDRSPMGTSARHLGPEEVVPEVLRRGAEALLELQMGRSAPELPPFLVNGVGAYYEASSWSSREFAPGAVHDEYLLRFRRADAQGRLPAPDQVVSDGSLRTEDFESYRKGKVDRVRGDRRAVAWLLVHFLMEGESKKHRTAFLGWFRNLATAKKSAEGDEPGTRLLAALRLQDPAVLLDRLRVHAAGMTYRGGRGHARVARELLEVKDAEGARDVAREGIPAAEGDARAMTDLAITLSSSPKDRGDASGLLRRALSVDPFHLPAWQALRSVEPAALVESFDLVSQLLEAAVR